jgi:glycosyltransferase involved in cell wall biosynthesis
MSQIHVMHITYDMRIGGTEMVIKNIIDGLTQPKNNTERNFQDDTDRHFRDDAGRHSRDGLIGNPQSLDPQLKPQADDDFKMSVLCIESPLGPFSEELKQNGIEFYELNRQPGFDTNLIKKIRQAIKNNQVDIIHCHQYTPWVYGVIAAAFTKTKVIFTEHGRFYPDSSTWKRKLINPILNLFTNHVTAISKATKQALTEFENIPAKYIEVIYNGISPLQIDTKNTHELRTKLNIPNNHVILGTVARFDPIKNHTMMLKAFSKALIQQPNCTLLIVGDGEERKNIEQCITDLKIDKNVILAGYEPKPAKHIALMDVFLLSSLSEGTSMTLLEAMSIGKPCIVTDAGGNPEIIINSENGFVTKNDDADEFAQAILTLLVNPEEMTKFGKNSKTIFNQLFSQNVMNDKFSTLYKWKAQ